MHEATFEASMEKEAGGSCTNYVGMCVFSSSFLRAPPTKNGVCVCGCAFFLGGTPKANGVFPFGVPCVHHKKGYQLRQTQGRTSGRGQGAQHVWRSDGTRGFLSTRRSNSELGARMLGSFHGEPASRLGSICCERCFWGMRNGMAEN